MVKGGGKPGDSSSSGSEREREGVCNVGLMLPVVLIRKGKIIEGSGVQPRYTPFNNRNQITT